MKDDILQENWLEEETVLYQPHARGQHMGTLIPIGMAHAVEEVLNRLEDRYGDLTEMVQHELQYPSEQDLLQVLGAEQIDGLAMALHEMKEGRGLILGNQTGFGKGRQNAAILRWAVMQGVKPVFVTEKSALFSDLYRDLCDIGSGHLRPFILNADREARVVDQNGKTVFIQPSEAEMEQFKQTGQLPQGYDMLLLTYSQMNRGQEHNWKYMPVLRCMAGSYLVMDECHNASGRESNINKFFLEAVKLARGVLYSSATYAKYATSMPVYALKTAIGTAQVNDKDLIQIVSAGGPILQEELAKGLAESGSMIRLQRDLSQVRHDLYMPQNEERIRNIRQHYDDVVDVVQEIYDFQKHFIQPYLTTIDAFAEVKAHCTIPAGESLCSDDCRTDYATFSSRMVPTIQQLLFASKADDAVELTLKLLQEGKKPIVQVNHTMEAQLKYLAGAGDHLDTTEFAQVLKACFFNLFHYAALGTTLDANSKKRKVANHYRWEGKITVNDLEAVFGTSEVRGAYQAILNHIEKTSTGLSVSPIDYFIDRVTKAGYTVGELTMRSLRLQFDEEGEGGMCVKRVQPGKKKLAAQFNNGEVDVLIGNRTMSAGISLHNSPVFQDTRPRSVITWELQQSADTQAQFDGRAERTGELDHCEFRILGSAIPAEQRYLMMHDRKQRSLNANVTASQKTGNAYLNILNKYGSRVVYEYLNEHSELLDLYPELKTEDKDKPTNAFLVNTFMQALALMPCKEQEALLTEVLTRYQDLIGYLDENGMNELEAKVLPLEAHLKERTIFSKGDPLSSSVFSQHAYLDHVEINVLRQPMSLWEIRQSMKGLLDVKSVSSKLYAYKEVKLKNINKRYKQLRLLAVKKLAEIQMMQSEELEHKYTPAHIQQLQARASDYQAQQAQADKVALETSEIGRELNRFRKGMIVGVPIFLDADYEVRDNEIDMSVSLGVFMGYKISSDKVTRSTIKAVFAVNDSRRKLEIPLTETQQLDAILVQCNPRSAFRHRYKGVKLEDWDERRMFANREEAYIITGNILQGIARAQSLGEKVADPRQRKWVSSKGRGKLISFTDEAGNLLHGYLLPRIFRPWDAMKYSEKLSLQATISTVVQGVKKIFSKI